MLTEEAFPFTPKSQALSTSLQFSIMGVLGVISAEVLCEASCIVAEPGLAGEVPVMVPLLGLGRGASIGQNGIPRSALKLPA